MSDQLFSPVVDAGSNTGTTDRSGTDTARSPNPPPDPALERRGRRWLLWSFVFCPCHLPLTMAVLAFLFGGTAFGALIAGNRAAVGIVFGLLYAAGVAVGFRHLRRARAGYDCSGGACTLPVGEPAMVGGSAGASPSANDPDPARR
ncbi:MAG: hypothetical protein ACK5PP_14515 [Acidimicrobiales bacterium]